MTTTTTTSELVPGYGDVTRLAVASFLARYREPTRGHRDGGTDLQCRRHQWKHQRPATSVLVPPPHATGSVPCLHGRVSNRPQTQRVRLLPGPAHVRNGKGRQGCPRRRSHGRTTHPAHRTRLQRLGTSLGRSPIRERIGFSLANDALEIRDILTCQGLNGRVFYGCPSCLFGGSGKCRLTCIWLCISSGIAT